jgi:Kef-type K+ transport system membrane component KefB
MIDWHQLWRALGREELVYVALLFGLFVFPRIIQRFAIPPAITAVFLGVATAVGPGWLVQDRTVELLAALGIVSLFLFAGLEVDTRQLAANRAAIVQHLLIRFLLLGAGGVVCHRVFGIAWRPACILALALLTPSTGFILDSIPLFGLTPREAGWVKVKAVATELLALGVLFFVIQSGATSRLAVSLGVIIAMLAVLPIVFRTFAKHIVPYAPGSEFAFVIIVAVVCALITRELGVYYLLGAFIVGVAARRFQGTLPGLTSRDLIRSIELFASFFIPFYFFHAGLGVTTGDLGARALLIGIVFAAVGVPLQALVVMIHRRLALGESLRHGLRIALALSPTLVFALVLAEILRDQFHVSREIYGGLVIFALTSTLIPGFVLRSPSPDFTSPHVPNDQRDAGPDVQPVAANAGGSGESDDPRAGPTP